MAIAGWRTHAMLLRYHGNPEDRFPRAGDSDIDILLGYFPTAPLAVFPQLSQLHFRVLTIVCAYLA
jgi:hypothetical protein